MNSLSGRLATGVLTVVAALLMLVPVMLTAPAGASEAGSASGSGTSAEQPRLPTAVNAPGAWSTAEGVRGPVSALGIATRTEQEGLFGEKESLEVFAVSALDGSASWIRMPGFSLDTGGLVGGFALSPDGQWVAWVRQDRPQRGSSASPVAGWSVMHTTSGVIRRLDVSGFPSVRGTLADLAFSGDSRYLLTSYETPDTPRTSRSLAHQFVAWDVEDATATVLEEPGRYRLPSLGSAPDGVVWARGRTVFRADPAGGDRTVVTLPQEVVTASWGPDGRSFAYIGRSAERPQAAWRLYGGRTIADARSRVLDLPEGVTAAQVLGWRDATHVVVGRFRSSVHVVDVVTGDVEVLDLSGSGEQVNAPYLAGALWQQPLVAPTPPEGTTDPRRPWWWISGLLVLLGAACLVWRVRRRRHDAPTDPAESDPPITTVQSQATPEYVALPSATPEPALRPLRTVGTGFILVLFDFRIQGVDLIPDPVGWVMVALALGSLQARQPGFRVAGIAAWTAVAPSLPEWIGVESALIGGAIAVALLIVQLAICTAIMGVSPARRATAAMIRRLVLGLNVALVLLIAAASADPSVEVVAFVVGLAGLGVTVWFLTMVFGVSRDAPVGAFERPHV